MRAGGCALFLVSGILVELGRRESEWLRPLGIGPKDMEAIAEALHPPFAAVRESDIAGRSEEHTSELQSL